MSSHCFFTENLSISQLNAHNAINELLKKKVIKKVSFKAGRGGYSEFEVTPGWADSLSMVDERTPPKMKNLKKSTKISNIYFISNPSRTKCKIGEAIDVDQRLCQIQTGNEEKLQILRVIQNMPVSFEREIHAKFDHLRLEGEWFTLTKELSQYIEYVEITQFVKEMISEMNTNKL